MFKQSLVCLAALCGVGAAVAQSSVTVFGILDADVRYVKNGSNKMTKVDSSGISTSRIGFRGTEDMGGGLKAGFWLEGAVNPDDGSAGATVNGTARFWNRRTTVSLVSDSLGEVRLGRDFSPVYRVATGNDPFNDTGMGAISRVFSTASINGAAYFTHTRMDNSVSYFLPGNLGGTYGQLSVAAGEGSAGNKLIGGLLGYKAGPLDVSGGYSTTEITTSKVKHAAVQGSYDFGVAKLAGSWSQLKYLTAKENHVSVAGIVPFGPSSLRASYVRSVGEGGTFTADNRKNIADMFVVGYWYDLSKRTTLYTNAVQIRNKGGAAFVVSSGPTLNGDKSTGLDVGIRHQF
jgi:predicted porin